MYQEVPWNGFQPKNQRFEAEKTFLRGSPCYAGIRLSRSGLDRINRDKRGPTVLRFVYRRSARMNLSYLCCSENVPHPRSLSPGKGTGPQRDDFVGRSRCWLCFEVPAAVAAASAREDF